MAISFTAILVSVAISAALSVGMRLISSLLAQNSNQQQYGGALPRAQDPGTQLTLREAAAPQRIVYGTRRVNGTVVFAHTTENNYLLHLVIAWAGHEIDSYGPLYFGDEEISLSSGIAQGKYFGKIGCEDGLGAADQGAFGNLISRAPGLWTADHRGRGIACSYITVHWDRTLFGQFDHSKIWRVINGKKVWDPRTEEIVFSHNAALIVADWMNSDKFGRGIPYDEMLGDDLEAAANVCDEDVELKAGGTEKRYACDAVLTSDTPFVDNVNKLLSAMRGEVFQLGGAWSIQAAAWEPPTLVFDEGDFREPFTVTDGVGREGFNAIKGKFANPAKNYQLDDFPAIIVPEYEIEDGGDGTGLGRVFDDVHLECTISGEGGQRLARIDLRAHRQPIAFTAKLKLTGLRARTGKNVAIDNAMMGWAEKPFKIKRMKYVPGFGVDGQPGVIGVDLDLVETGEFVFDHTASDIQIRDPIPNTNLPDPANVLPPSNLTATESLYFTRGVGVKAKVAVAFDASPDAFVADGGWYIVEYMRVGDAAWTRAPRIENGATSIDLSDFEPGIYDFRAWSFQYTGARSQTPITLRQYIAGLSTPPAPPVSFTVEAMESFALARAARPADLDVEHGGWVVFKHAPVISGASWSTALTLSDPLPANAGAWALPLKAGTYLLEIYDSSGNPSGTPSTFYVDQSSAHDFVPLAGGLATFDPDFAGTKTGCGVVGAVLTLAGTGLISSIPAISAVRSIAYFGGVSSSGYVDYDDVMDLLTKKRHRLTNTVEAAIVSVIDRISERSNNVSDWPRIGNGATGDEADSRLLVASTDDDPAAAPVWSDWLRLDSSTFNCRAHKFRRVLEAYDPTFTPGISADAVVAEGV